MWISADRVVHVAAVPGDSRALESLRDLLAAFSTEQLQTLDEELFGIQWSVADQIDEMNYDEELERTFAGVAIPTELLTDLDWNRILAKDIEAELEDIDLRWRVDVVGIVSQAIADIG